MTDGGALMFCHVSILLFLLSMTIDGSRSATYYKAKPCLVMSNNIFKLDNLCFGSVQLSYGTCPMIFDVVIVSESCANVTNYLENNYNISIIHTCYINDCKIEANEQTIYNKHAKQTLIVWLLVFLFWLFLPIIILIIVFIYKKFGNMYNMIHDVYHKRIIDPATNLPPDPEIV